MLVNSKRIITGGVLVWCVCVRVYRKTEAEKFAAFARKLNKLKTGLIVSLLPLYIDSVRRWHRYNRIERECDFGQKFGERKERE